jgi:3-oxoadipate enol-lactonase
MPTFTTVDNYDIHYEIHYNVLPATTLFIHGNLSSNQWWYPSLEIFNKKKVFDLPGHMIMAELRGFGNSDTPFLSKVNVKQFASDFLSLIKQQDWGKVNLVGHSTGGIISTLMLASNSELFNRAVLLDPVGATGLPLTDQKRQLFKVMEKDKSVTSLAIGGVIYRIDYNSDFFKNIIVEDAQKSIKLGLALFEDLNNFNIVDTLNKANIENKVLVLHGDKDAFLSIEDSKKLASYFSNSIFQVIKNQGHSLNVENPALFVRIITNFLFEKSPSFRSLF